MLAEEFIVIQTDPHREIQVGMQRTDRETAFCHQRFEEPKLY